MLTRVLVLAVLVVPIAWAQDPNPADADQQAREAAERRADWQLRMYGQLGLSEAQTSQLKAILVDDELQTAKRRDERRLKIREFLTPAQREQFDQLVERQGGGGRGGAGGGRMGGMGGMGGMDPTQLRERLKLTDDQATKIQAVLTEMGPQFMEKFRSMRQEGGFDPTKMREAFGELRAEANTKIEALLTDEQKPEWQKMVKEFDDQMAQWMPGAGGGRGPGGGERAPRESRESTPEEQIKRRLDNAMTALALSTEEAAVIQPLVEKVIQYQVSAGRAVRDLRDAAGKLEDEEQIRAKIEEYRKAREEFEHKLGVLSSGLRELLTVQQEAKLFSLRVLELDGQKSE